MADFSKTKDSKLQDLVVSSPQHPEAPSSKRMKLTLKLDRPTLQGSFGRYKLGQKIGSGAFAVVRLGTNVVTGENVAVKLIDKRFTTQDMEAKEVALLKSCGSHPHIVALLESFETGGEWGLVLELACGGEVFERLAQQGAPFSERDAAGVVRQVAKALAHCHAKNICHRDVKPENLLYVSSSNANPTLDKGCSGGGGGIVKLADFGLAEQCGGRVKTGTSDTGGGTGGNNGRTCSSLFMTGKVGTLAYMAPEMLQSGSSTYGMQIDSWALGVSLFILLGGYLPFDPQQIRSPAEMESAIKAFEPAFTDELGGWSESWVHVSEEAKGVIKALLHPDPAQRATPESLLADDDPCLWMAADPSKATSTSAPLPRADEMLRHFNNQRRIWRLAADAVGLVVNAPCVVAAAAARAEEGSSGGTADSPTGVPASSEGVVTPAAGREGGEEGREGVEKGRAVVAAAAAAAAKPPQSPLDESALDDMRRAFRIFDEDGNGFVDITELVHVVCHLGGTEADAECMLEAMDANHDGLITFEDFCTASAPLYNGGQAALRRAFDLIDDDHKGFLDVKKLEVLLKRLGMHCSRGTVHLPPSRATHDDDNAAATANDDEGKASSLKEDPGIYDQSELLSDVFASADMNHDGRVSFPEFLALFNKPKALSGDLVKSFSSQAGKGSGVPSAE